MTSRLAAWPEYMVRDARALWPSATDDEIGSVLRAAVARRERTDVTFTTAAWVEAVLARDAATEG